MKKLLLPLMVAGMMGLSGPILAAVDTNPTTVQQGIYHADTAHTRVTWAVNHFGFNDYYGEFVGTTATLSLDPSDLSKTSVEVQIPTSQVATTNAKLDAELKSAEWFDAEKFPNITFKSTKVTQVGANSADITGDLTLRGVTKEVTLRAVFNGAGPNPMTKAYTTGFHATGSLKRSDFGVTAYIPAVSDEVKINISIAFELK